MKKYNVIYADPPWCYKSKHTGNKMRHGAVQKYPVMELSEICGLPISTLCEKNAVLYLWATTPLLPEAFQVMKAWGFKYKTTLTWRKIMSMGLGYWYRGQTEHLLFGVKGKVKAFRIQEANFIQCKAGRHSEKPELFRELIERSTPHLMNKVELFARKETIGWDVFGNEVNNSISITN